MSQRSRVTVTIQQNLLKKLDALIDGNKVRNRSHALETVLAKNLGNSTKQAVILASGKGVKMRPFTYEMPKPMIPVNGKPILQHTIELLRNHGITDIIITTSYLSEKIEKHFGDGEAYGVNISYVKEKKPTGTAGALRAAKKKLTDDNFLMLYGDILLDLDLEEFLQAQASNRKAVGTLAVTNVADPSAYGAMKLRGNKVVGFEEKPEAQPETSRLVFAGCAAFNKTIFDYLKKTGEQSLESDVFPKLIADGLLFGYPFEGMWFDVSTPEAYENALKNWGK